MLLHSSRNFLKDKRATIATTFAVSIIPVLICMGVVVDYSNLVRHRGKVTHSADTALLAAAISIKEEGLIGGDAAAVAKKLGSIEQRLDEVFRDYFAANMSDDLTLDLGKIDLAYDPKTGESEVKVSFSYKPYFVGVLGLETLDVTVGSAVVVGPDQGGAVSIFLVLDKSGSMRQHNKMRSLKIAVGNMSAQLELSDPDHKFVRMGAAAYDSTMASKRALMWGTTPANYYVQRLGAYGGTDSSRAVSTARSQLRNRREKRLHKEKNGQEPEKFMIFMTDGTNNTSRSDTKTMRSCDWAKADEIEIFSVAFKAPARGQRLLRYCASSENHYFNADNSAELLKAFQQIGASVSAKVAISQ